MVGYFETVFRFLAILKIVFCVLINPFAGENGKGGKNMIAALNHASDYLL
jgi:hypothetical protein